MSLRSETARPRLLGVFAHPDDAVFCAGGTLAKYVAAGAEAMVISATPGDAGQVRERELRLACTHLGVQHVARLDYRDGTLKDVDRSLLVANVVRAIRSFRPDVVVTFGPAGAYGHPDHVAVSLVTTEALTLAGDAAYQRSRQAPARLHLRVRQVPAVGQIRVLTQRVPEALSGVERVGHGCVLSGSRV